MNLPNKNKYTIVKQSLSVRHRISSLRLRIKARVYRKRKEKYRRLNDFFLFLTKNKFKNVVVVVYVVLSSILFFLLYGDSWVPIFQNRTKKKIYGGTKM